MHENINMESLERVVIEILQDAAFIFAEPTERMEPDEEKVLVARLGFNGPSSGEMLLSCSPLVATDFAANLLGIDADDPEAASRGADALCEMLNIVGGALLANWFGVDGEFEMGVPSVLQIDSGQYSDETRAAALMLPLETDEGERIDVAILA